jgi:hypothetical protein
MPLPVMRSDLWSMVAAAKATGLLVVPSRICSTPLPTMISPVTGLARLLSRRVPGPVFSKPWPPAIWTVITEVELTTSISGWPLVVDKVSGPAPAMMSH